MSEPSLSPLDAPVSGSEPAAPRGLRGPLLALWHGHIAVLRFAMVICMAALTLAISTEVVTRYLLGFSIFAIEDFAKLAAVYMYFIGAAHSVWHGEAVASSMIEHIFRKGLLLNLGIHLRHIATIGIAVCILIWSWDYVAFVFHRKTMSVELGIHLYWFYGIVPLSLGLTILYHLIQYVEWMLPARGAQQ